MYSCFYNDDISAYGQSRFLTGSYTWNHVKSLLEKQLHEEKSRRVIIPHSVLQMKS